MKRPGVILRWLKFSVVGAGGLAVQLAVLWACTRLAGISLVVATIIAVETALLHNFGWHEIWTWRGSLASGRFTRLWRFHAATGSISILSNVVFTVFFKHEFAIPLLLANVMAVAVTGIVNFLAADFWVFSQKELSKKAC
jgi:putative flippase GtrA